MARRRALTRAAASWSAIRARTQRRGRDARPGAARPGAARPVGRYGALLLLLIATYLLSASGLGGLASDLQTFFLLVVVLLAVRPTQTSHRTVRLVTTAALIGSAIAADALTHTRGGAGVADIWRGLVLLLTAVLIVRRVLARPTVTLQSIYGALSAYLIIGLMFAAVYAAIQHLGPATFFAHRQPANTQTFQYFSFTTLTTLGYGDFTAVGNGARALAVIEALTGQVFLATLVARLVAAFRVPSEPARPAAGRRRPPGNAGPGSRVWHHRAPPGSTRKASRRRDR